MLDYFALGLLVFTALVLFYGVIAIHDIPYEMAVHRQHPQQDAIHVAGWVSLFTLHAIWPFLWIWATLYRPDRGWGFINEKEIVPKLIVATEALQDKVNELEKDKSAMGTLLEKMNDLSAKVQQLESKTNIQNNDNMEGP